ncbi:MAG: HAD hydrolase family protein, partial [Bacteroidales bacterium]|nr:HAD hydrolase family protein [Bacteroidales bacterium]
RPTLFCHSLTINEKNQIINYNLRQKDPKRKVVQALKSLDYKVVAFGDSYNDVSMLQEADNGILYKPPQKVVDDFPQFPVCNNYEELKKELSKYI